MEVDQPPHPEEVDNQQATFQICFFKTICILNALYR
jgi:hypothetical protein